MPVPSRAAVRQWEDMQNNTGDPIRLATVLDSAPEGGGDRLLAVKRNDRRWWALGARSRRETLRRSRISASGIALSGI
jgi:hypothetical protein